jgi:hypothetical protein
MIEPRADRPTPITLAADKGYDAEDFVNELLGPMMSLGNAPSITNTVQLNATNSL